MWGRTVSAATPIGDFQTDRGPARISCGHQVSVREVPSWGRNLTWQIWPDDGPFQQSVAAEHFPKTARSNTARKRTLPRAKPFSASGAELTSAIGSKPQRQQLAQSCRAAYDDFTVKREVRQRK